MQNYTSQQEETQANQQRSNYADEQYAFNTGQNAEFNQYSQSRSLDLSGQATYLSKVFAWMFLGLFLTGATSFIVMNSKELFVSVANLMFPLLIIELIAVGFLSFRVSKLSATTCTIIFFTYSFLNGLTLAPILSIYTASSAASVFMITAATFAVMAVYGMTTKKDLTSMGSLLFMGLIGILISVFINIFLQNGVFDIVISCFAVFIFTGLTAYDAQTIKNNYINGIEYTKEGHKMAIMSALSLYLNFINLFIHLLRLFGDRD